MHSPLQRYVQIKTPRCALLALGLPTFPVHIYYNRRDKIRQVSKVGKARYRYGTAMTMYKSPVPPLLRHALPQVSRAEARERVGAVAAVRPFHAQGHHAIPAHFVLIIGK